MDPSSTSGDQALDSEIGQQVKESSIQKLKRQKREAEAQVNMLNVRLEGLENQMGQLVQAMSNNQQPQRQASGELSTDQLESIVLNPETDPSQSNYAMLKLMQELMKKEREAIKQSVVGEFKSELEQDRRRNEVVTRINRDFGTEAWDKESDTYQVADAIYRQYQNRYGKDLVSKDPEYLHKSFLEAKMKIDSERQVAPQLAAEEPTVPTGPSPESQVEGGGSGTADLLAARNNSLDSGDWKSALKATTKSLYPE